MLHVDAITQKVTQATYTVDQAQAGTWMVKLSGEIGPDHNYLLSVLGSNPPPALSEVSAVVTGPEEAEVGWRLTSEEANTFIDIYVTHGPITYTAVITQAGGITTTQNLPLFTGSVLATGLASPVDGTPQTYTLDLSQLESGTYWVWLEAEDGRNPPVRTYAPDPITVDHSGLLMVSASNNWDADIEVTPGYRRLDVQWDRNPHPDIDGYVLYVGTAPVSATKAITVGDTTVAFLSALDPGRTYYLSVGAHDHHSGQTILSEEVAATTDAAEFDMTTPSTELSIVGGQKSDVVVTLTTTSAPYPETVSLSAGHITPDGIVVIFESTLVTPTVEGVPMTITISTTHSLPAGEYVAPIVAHGGGVVRTLNLRLTVLEPLFALGLTPDAVTLTRGESAEVVISATGIHGEGDPIHLHLEGAPPGLDWAYSSEVVRPGENVTLVLTDTHISGQGKYELHILAEDGENTQDFSLMLTLWEPEFGIEAAEPRLTALAGEMAAFALDVTAQNGWTHPVTLSLDAQYVPPQTAVGFLELPPSSKAICSDDFSRPGTSATEVATTSQAMQAEITVTPPTRVFLAVVTTPNTPEGLYLLRVNGEGGELERSLLVKLEVREERILYWLYLPVVMKQ